MKILFVSAWATIILPEASLLRRKSNFADVCSKQHNVMLKESATLFTNWKIALESTSVQHTLSASSCKLEALSK
jgi:hypothetical protein